MVLKENVDFFYGKANKIPTTDNTQIMQTGLNSHDMSMDQIINIFQWFRRFVGCMEHSDDYKKETVHGIPYVYIPNGFEYKKKNRPDLCMCICERKKHRRLRFLTCGYMFFRAKPHFARI